jgi:hypothetical protein
LCSVSARFFAKAPANNSASSEVGWHIRGAF